MSIGSYILWTILGTVVLIAIKAITFYFSADAGLRRKWRSIQVTPISKVADRSLAKIAGKALAPATLLTSPLGKVPCIAFRLIALFHDDSDEQGASCSEMDIQKQGLAFIIDDASDKADVEFNIATARLFGDGAEYRQVDGELMRRFEKEQPHGRLACFQEVVLLPGADVTVCGRGSWEVDKSDPFAGYRDVKRRLRMEPPTKEEPMIVIVESLAPRLSASISSP